jgi:hypothetical protein
MNPETIKLIIHDFYYASRSSQWDKVKHYTDTPVTLVFNAIYIDSVPVLWFEGGESFWFNKRMKRNDVCIQLVYELTDAYTVTLFETHTPFVPYESMSSHVIKAYRNTSIVSGLDYLNIIKVIVWEAICNQTLPKDDNVPLSIFSSTHLFKLRLINECETYASTYADNLAIIWLSDSEPSNKQLFSVWDKEFSSSVNHAACSCLYQDARMFLSSIKQLSVKDCSTTFHQFDRVTTKHRSMNIANIIEEPNINE